ncbi:MAG: helix-turn-helix transcriptional regulator [Acidobacteriota bacterium]|nr:helix-turn-helix transcriptional regulator [Acidobacteriota bacterium]
MKFVGERLMSARVQCGLSLEDAAEEADVDGERLAAAEAGRLGLEEDELVDLADVYGQPLEWFFGGETTPVQYLPGLINLGGSF